jgi:hypothetical protein
MGVSIFVKHLSKLLSLLKCQTTPIVLFVTFVFDAPLYAQLEFTLGKRESTLVMGLLKVSFTLELIKPVNILVVICANVLSLKNAM